MAELGHLAGQLFGRGDEQLAERARVDEAQASGLGEGDDHVGVLVRLLLGRPFGAQKLTAHSEVDDEDVAALELDQQVLAPAVDPHDLAALELAGEVLLVGVPADRSHAADVDLLDALADDLLLEVAPQRLDFGQLRHRRSPRRRRSRLLSSRPWW